MKYLLISFLLLASCIIEKQEDSEEPETTAETSSSSISSIAVDEITSSTSNEKRDSIFSSSSVRDADTLRSSSSSSSFQRPDSLFSSSSSKIEETPSSSSLIEIPESLVDTFACDYSWDVCSDLRKSGTYWKSGDYAYKYQELCDTVVLAELMRSLPFSKVYHHFEYHTNGSTSSLYGDSLIINHQEKRIDMYGTEYSYYDVITGADLVCLKSGKYEDYNIYNHVNIKITGPYPIQN